jgi:hypothetical protein
MPRSYARGGRGLITSEVIAALPVLREDWDMMTAKRILRLNAVITAVSAAAMLLARPYLYPLFGLSSPLWLDLATAVFIVYAVALVAAASRTIVPRAALWAFTIGDGACFALSVLLLVVFWSDFTPVARALIGLTALVVDGFAMAQYRAARLAS